METALRTVANAMSVELKFDPALRPEMLRQIDFIANKVTHKQLIELVLQGTELKYELDDKTLEIRK